MSTNVFGKLVLTGGHAIANRTRKFSIACRSHCLRFCLQASQINSILFCTLQTPIIIVSNVIIIQTVGASILFAHRLPLAQILASYNILVRIVRTTLTMVVIFINVDIVFVVVVLLVVVIVGAASQVVRLKANAFFEQFNASGVAVWCKRGIIDVVVVLSNVVIVGGASQVVMVKADAFFEQLDASCVAVWCKGGIVGGVVGARGAATARCGLGADIHWFDGRVRVDGEASTFHLSTVVWCNSLKRKLSREKKNP